MVNTPPIDPGPDEELFHEPAPEPEHLAPPSVAPIIGTSPPSGPGGFPPPLAAEPSARRLRQFGFLAALTVLVVVFAVWLLVSWNHKQDEAKDNAAAANQLCKQLTTLGQPCAAQAVTDGVSTPQAVVPVLPGASASLMPVSPGANGVAPTDENGVPQAYQPGPDALVVAVGVAHDRLILTYSDGARVDAGPVDLATLAIVLRAQVSASPSPFPSASPSPSPVETMPPGDDVPEPTWTVRPTEFEPPKDLESESTP
jgi:hypothetical protein